ncbi:MAG: OmpA family protein [Granulosicoccus sp.]
MKQTPIRPLIVTGLLTLALTACGGAPKKVESLEEARSAYTRASSDATIARHAPSELDQANDALKNAEHAWNDDEHRSRVDHYAYLASQRIHIAELISQGKEADKELANMKLERQRVQLDLRSDELDRRQREAEELRRQMEEMQAKSTERGIVLTLGDVLFDTNEADLKTGSMINIERIADFMKTYPERIAIVEGHTDNMGEADYNMDLSEDRAFSVRQALAKNGISTSRITTRGFGMDRPVATNRTSAGRQENRRVEIIFPDGPTQVSELSE